MTDDHLHIANFCFVHDIAQACQPSAHITYYFSGHIHPCILLKGPGKQTLSFSCYYFSESFAILPAFSKFTGGASIEPKSSDNVFAIIPANSSKKEHAAVVKVTANR
ncbi:MAG: hypothetical protein WKG06_39900 [Segetibacter sp.]